MPPPPRRTRLLGFALRLFFLLLGMALGILLHVRVVGFGVGRGVEVAVYAERGGDARAGFPGVLVRALAHDRRRRFAVGAEGERLIALPRGEPLVRQRQLPVVV